MQPPTPPTPSELVALEAFLANPARPEGTLSLGELHGFLFAVTSAPEMVRFPEIFDFVFGDLSGVFENVAEADRVMGWIGGLYNQINAGVLSGEPKLPRGVSFRDDPMENFDPDGPVAHWARGFASGHEWLAESWDIELPEAMEDDLDEDLMILCWFASRERAEEYDTHRQPDDPPFEVVCERCVRYFTDAMASYAHIGRSIYEARLEVEGRAPIRRDPVPARNDPCPCGSGRKYKKCCGANIH